MMNPAKNHEEHRLLLLVSNADPMLHIYSSNPVNHFGIHFVPETVKHT